MLQNSKVQICKFFKKMYTHICILYIINYTYIYTYMYDLLYIYLYGCL